MRRGAVAVAATLLAGCASVDPKPAFVDVGNMVADRTGAHAQWIQSAEDASAVQDAVRALLKEELTPDAAVQVALLNNRSMQAVFEEIGVSQADLAQAGLISNPELEGAIGFPNRAEAATRLSGGIVQDLLSILIRPLRTKIGAAELEMTKLRVGDEMLTLIAETKAAYYGLQARLQLVSRLELILDINRTAAEFALKQYEAGNLGELDLQNQLAIANQTRADFAIASAQVRSDREALNRLMGLWGPDTVWSIPDRLPEIPEQEVSLDRLETLAIENRLDIESARWGVDLVGRALALRKGTRYFPVGIHIGIRTEREPEAEPGAVRTIGPSLALQLPLFDTGRASIARLEAQYRQSQRQLEALAINARSEVRETRDRLIAWRDVAGYYRSVLLPQRVRILDLTLRHYNMMLKGAYDLLLAKQNEVAAERAYIEAWREYWIARSGLELAVGGRLPSASAQASREARPSSGSPPSPDAPSKPR